ncbi:MAG TPA: TPM domain-containing protein [Xanthobacteraceae bacterium]|nr:TPM domain-containing protein [Xanthobacteraceae bacterium]
MRPSALAAGALLALLWACVALALNFPALSGRVVDQANIVPADARAAIEGKLADLESKSGIQLVVATVASLEGEEIEPYANQLFRTWKLGQKDKNNGVLLLVAPNEHRVRIEVGYGLEGTLTDALSKVIITNAIAPRFKTGDFAGGITRGVDDIITVLTTDASEWQKKPALRLDSQENTDPVGWVLVLGGIVLVILLIVSPGFRWLFFNILVNIALSSGSRSSSGGGGFSGGGGSSGGGGASGSW